MRNGQHSEPPLAMQLHTFGQGADMIFDGESGGFVQT